MNEQDLLLIERYFRNELNEAERRTFEKRRADDPAFQAQVVLQEKAMAAIRFHGRDSLKKKLQERPPVEHRRRPFRWWRELAGFIVVALLVAWWWSRPTRPDSPTINPANPPADSTQQMQRAPAIDTALQKLPPSNSKPPVAERKTDADKLFAATFKPYKDESLQPSVRAEGEPGPFEQFQQLYWEGKYAETLSAFEQLSPNVKNSDNTLFVKANALLATAHAAEAAALLEGIRVRKRSAYTDQTGWYLALAYLKMGEAPKAKELLQQIASDKGSPRRGEAERLLDNLR